jgi:hypothetical protein
VDLDKLSVAYLHDPELNRGKLDVPSLQHFTQLLQEVSGLCINDQEPISQNFCQNFTTITYLWGQCI